MHSVREVLVVDLEFRPEIFEDVILKGDVGEDWITKRRDGVNGGIDRGDRILLADGRLNVELQAHRNHLHGSCRRVLKAHGM
jgi:hypothetical protein